MRSPGRRRPSTIASRTASSARSTFDGAGPRGVVQTTWNSGASIPPSKRSALIGATSMNGARPRHQIAQDLAGRRALQEAVAGEPGGVQEARDARRLADHGVVVRAHVVQPGPAALDGAGAIRGARRSAISSSAGIQSSVVSSQEAGRLVRVGHAHEQPAALAVEVEAGGEVDRQRQLGAAGRPSAR